MQVNPRTEEAFSLFMNGTLALARAEQQGICLDIPYVERQIKLLTHKIAKLEDEFKQTTFFRHWEHSVNGTVNINSDTQLRHFLYDVKKYKISKYTYSGQGATDAEALSQLNIPELDILAQRDKLKRLRDVNLDGFLREQVNGVIHPFFNLHLAHSFRSSSNSPNFQNIPVRDEESMQICRKALYPRKGHQLLEVDFKSIEVSVNACINKDTNLLKYCRNPKLNMHTDMTKQIFKIEDFDKKKPDHNVLRQAIKNGFVFPEFYGDYYKNCAENMACNWGKLGKGRWKSGEGIPLNGGTLSDHLISNGLSSLQKFEIYLQKIEKDFWENRFPEYAEWKDRWWSIYKKYGYFTTPTGFTCSGVLDKKQVCNIPAQGSAFHCLLWSFIETDKVMREEKWDSRLIGQIHDSMIGDILPSELPHIVKTIKRITTEELPEAWKWIIVPMGVEMAISPVDRPWSEKKEFTLNLT